ncbi:inositol 2-dehydrogenase [Novosphingobium guangzhouense]|uniref:Inositol 2-dehydrogenase n=1 Tax=Novosphingobium guangzhouense TaxID=1850347 RepID=A0A2K2G5V9_9SPHN|nr:inositol 2-dehydrogenase [Novosphingobium guangzhouense]PNU06414.1 inositol 2-dehydrogenase [Novosphingobium guangzhouense]
MLRIAVLGAGRIGRIHSTNVAAHPNAKLIAIADPVAAAVDPLAEALGAEAMNDPIAAIDRDDVDAIVIGTPSDNHADLLLHAVAKGKAVMCEKPIDAGMERSQAVVDDVKAKGGKVMMAFNRRFETSFAAIRKAIEAGEIGEVRQVIISSRDPGLPPEDYVKSSGGIFRDMTIHDLDMARFMLGEEPVEVSATASRIVDEALTAKYDDYDTVMVTLKTASGKQCHINNCREAVYGYDQRVEVFGATGMLQHDNLRPTTVRRWTADITEAQEPLLNFFLQRYAQAYASELDAFITALVEGKPLPTSVEDGLKALALAEAAIESVRTGQTVRL